jgi:hypothetical protein
MFRLISISLCRMRKGYLFLLLWFFFGCSFSKSSLPLITESFPPQPLVSFVYVGEGRAYRFSEGSWKDFPSYNYEFTVLQRRYENRWESIKEIHRRHPLYYGKAGEGSDSLFQCTIYSYFE